MHKNLKKLKKCFVSFGLIINTIDFNRELEGEPHRKKNSFFTLYYKLIFFIIKYYTKNLI